MLVVPRRLDADDNWETKTAYEYKQTGTRDEWNSAKGKYERKPVYQNVPVTKHIKHVQGEVEGTFEIRYLVPGEYVVEVRAAGFRGERRAGQLGADKPQPVEG